MNIYEKYRISKKHISITRKMILFTNLVASVNDGPIKDVIIKHYREDRLLIIYNCSGIGPGSAYSLNFASVNSDVLNELKITAEQDVIRIVFPNLQTRTFFMQEILRCVFVITLI